MTDSTPADHAAPSPPVAVTGEALGSAPPGNARRRLVWVSIGLLVALLVTVVGTTGVIAARDQGRLDSARSDRAAARSVLDDAIVHSMTDGVPAGRLQPVTAEEVALLREGARPNRLRVFDAGEIQHVSAQAATLRGLVGRVDHIEATLTDAGRLDAATVLTRLDDAVSQERAAGLDAGTDAVLAVAARDTVGHASSPVAVQAAVTGLADRATAIVQRAQAKLAVDQAAAALAARRNDASAALTRGDRLLLQAAPLTGLQYATDSATIAAQHQAFTAAVTLAQYDAVTGTATDAADHIAALLAARSGAYTDMASARTNLQRASTEKVDAGTAPAQLDALQAQLDQAGTGAAFNAVDRAITQVMAPILDRIGIAELGIGKVIVMSLDRQSLTAYQDGVALVTTPITTGRPALPTPPGSYSVLRKNHPWLMTSDWPRSSPYWYPPSEVQYTLWFRNDGYAIHDAPWRSRYGPGTQANGSHGCVNVPMPTMTTLFSWADVGTRVIVK